MEYNFGKIQAVLDTPNLTALQRNAYEHFLKTGIKEALKEFSPVKDYNDSLYLYFEDCELVPPTVTPKECIEKGLTYCSKLVVKCLLQNQKTGEINFLNSHLKYDGYFLLILFILRRISEY